MKFPEYKLSSTHFYYGSRHMHLLGAYFFVIPHRTFGMNLEAAQFRLLRSQVVPMVGRPVGTCCNVNRKVCLQIDSYNNYNQSSPHDRYLRARLNGFNICPTSIQQKLNGCWANVGQMLNGVSNGFNSIRHFREQRKCCMEVE